MLARRSALSALALVTPAGLAAPWLRTAAAQPRELRLGSPWPTTGTPHVALVTFAAEVEKMTQGRIRVRVFPDSQLGDIQALINGLQLGTIDMSYLAIGNAGVLRGGAPLNVAYVPYLFNTKQDSERIANSPVFTDMYDTLAREAGVRIFAVYGARSPRGLQNSKRAVARPEDVRGLRIRVPPIDGLRLAFEKMGARPVVMGLGDTYQAISRNQVDGHENGIDAAIGFKWYEVAKHWTQTSHVFETAAFYANERLWQSFSPGDREAIIAAARAGGADMTAATERLDAEGLATFKANGVTTTEADIAAFRTALRDVATPLEGRVWPEGLVARLRAMQG